MTTEHRHPDRTSGPDINAQRAETGAAGTVGPSTSALPASMSRGLLRGGLLGAVVGAAVLTPLSAIPLFDLDFFARLVIVMVIGIAAGAAGGAVFFGSATAELADEDSEGDADVVPERIRRR